MSTKLISRFILFILVGSILASGCSLFQRDPALDEPCQPGEICVTVTADDVTGKELRLILYETVEEDWPTRYRSIPTPSWVITEYPAVPEKFPIRIRIPMTENLFAVSGDKLEGARFGLAIATGVASFMVIEPTDARGFSEATMIYEEGKPMEYGEIKLEQPKGGPCELNAFLPGCQSGSLFWEDHLLGAESFVPGAVYIEVADVDEDGIDDVITVGEPHFEEPDLSLEELKLGVYYMNADLTVRESEIVDQWTEEDQAFYSPWGVRVINHGGKPMIIVGTNIPGLLPLEEGFGNIFGYQKQDGDWVRLAIRENPDPLNENFNAMIVVPCDIDQDGDDDIALSGAYKSSSVGSWMENTGEWDQPWVSHLQPMAPGTDPYIRGTLAYKCADLNNDSYPEVIYNGMFDVANTDPPRYRGEIWLALNPGPEGWDQPWEMVVIDDDNWASADMWFHDFDDDGYLDLIANQIFSSTVTHYQHPGESIFDPWEDTVIISGLTSPSDMWLTDMDNDGFVDIVSADHTAHNGVWHKNPGDDIFQTWEPNSIFRGIRMPGDFAMVDMDRDGDLDYVGTSMTLGQIFIVEQTNPDSSLVVKVNLPDGFDQTITKLVVLLTKEVPLQGIPKDILVNIDNGDIDGDGTPDIDQMFGSGDQLSLTLADTNKDEDFYVMANLYVEGGGMLAPKAGVDFSGYSEQVRLGLGPVEVEIDLFLAE